MRLVGRDREIRSIAAAVARGQSVVVVGGIGSGRSALLDVTADAVIRGAGAATRSSWVGVDRFIRSAAEAHPDEWLIVDDVPTLNRGDAERVAGALFEHGMFAASCLRTAGAAPGVADTLAARGAVVVEARPLTLEEVALSIGPAAEPAIDLEATVRRAAGRPLFVEALMSDVGDVVPAAVVDRLRRALRSASDEEVDVLRALAVLGPCSIFEAATVAAVDPRRVTSLVAALRARGLVDATALLVEVPVLAEAVLKAEPADVVDELHHRAASTRQRLGAGAEVVAHHLMRCAPRGHASAADALSTAAAFRRAAGDPAGATAFLRRALLEPPANEDILRVVLALADALVADGEPSLAADHLLAWLECWRNEPKRAAPVLRRLVPLLVTTDRGIEARVILDRFADSDDAALRSEVDASRHTFAWTHRAARASEVPPPTEGTRAVAQLAFAGMREANVDAAACARLALSALADASLYERAPMDALLLVITLERCGHLRSALEAGVELRGRAATAGDRTAILAFDSVLARIHLRKGELEPAIEMSRTCVGRASTIATPAAGVLAQALLATDGPASATTALEDAGVTGEVPDTGPDTENLFARAVIELETARYQEALRDFEEVGRRREVQGSRSPAGLHWQPGAIRCLAVLGRASEALALSDLDMAVVRRWHEATATGRALAARAMASSPAERLSLLEEAAATVASAEAPLERASVVAELGVALRRHGQLREARAALREAVSTASTVGATHFLTRWSAELAATGERRARVNTLAHRQLTSSEARVAQLAASGLSNAEIAMQLHLSVKTIEMRLSAVYRKLGLGGRKELRAVVKDQGPTL